MVYLLNGILFSIKIIYVIMWVNLENMPNVINVILLLKPISEISARLEARFISAQEVLVHSCLAPLLLGLWQSSTLWWEHRVKDMAHATAARKQRERRGWVPNVPLRSCPRDLTSSSQAPPSNGSTTSQWHHSLETNPFNNKWAFGGHFRSKGQ